MKIESQGEKENLERPLSIRISQKPRQANENQMLIENMGQIPPGNIQEQLVKPRRIVRVKPRLNPHSILRSSEAAELRLRNDKWSENQEMPAKSNQPIYWDIALLSPQDSTTCSTLEYDVLLKSTQRFDKKQSGSVYFLNLERQASIGRGSQCALVIIDESISREHCKLSTLAGKIYIQDAGSLTGTFLRLNQRLLIKKGLELVLGTTCLLFDYVSCASVKVMTKETKENDYKKNIFDVFWILHKVRIGSSIGADLELRDYNVAPFHAVVEQEGTDWYFSDLGYGYLLRTNSKMVCICLGF